MRSKRTTSAPTASRRPGTVRSDEAVGTWASDRAARSRLRTWSATGAGIRGQLDHRSSDVRRGDVGTAGRRGDPDVARPATDVQHTRPGLHAGGVQQRLRQAPGDRVEQPVVGGSNLLPAGSLEVLKCEGRGGIVTTPACADNRRRPRRLQHRAASARLPEDHRSRGEPIGLESSSAETAGHDVS